MRVVVLVEVGQKVRGHRRDAASLDLATAGGVARSTLAGPRLAQFAHVDAIKSASSFITHTSNGICAGGLLQAVVFYFICVNGILVDRCEQVVASHMLSSNSSF